MKQPPDDKLAALEAHFSALGRAVWDETSIIHHLLILLQISVLSVEPYGMKPYVSVWPCECEILFQCSRSSRMG